MKRKFSQRASRPTKRFRTSHEVYIEGHGEIDPHMPKFKVPDSLLIVVYQGIGIGLDDDHGVAIVEGRGLPSTLPVLWDAQNGEYDTDPGGDQTAGTGHRRIYMGGEMCPNLKLFPYDHPAMADLTDSVDDRSYKIGYRADRPNYFQYLKDIAALSVHRGATLHWAACTVIR